MTPFGRVKGGGEPMGHRVGDGNELHVEGTDLAPLAVAHRDELGPAQQASFLDAAARQAQGQLGAVDREGQLPQQEARDRRSDPRDRG